MFLVSRACVPLMADQGGAIINTASVQALTSQRAVAAYATSKSGVLGLTRSMAVDLAPSIRVNAILPGAVDTPMLRTALATAKDPEAVHRDLERANLLGRVARPEEIASVVVFLAGPDASFMTGAAIVVDGGLLARIPGSPAE
jgi:NAD(P)-dependent dehydrogenase (short-subunit alcohol dehydrogenase family)